MVSTKPILEKLLFEKMFKLPELIVGALNNFRQKLVSYVLKSDHQQVTIDLAL